jgi:hypothetical protein
MKYRLRWIRADRFKLWVSGVVSLSIHTLMLLGLAFFVISGQNSTNRQNFLTVVSPNDVGDLHDVDFEITPKIASEVEASQAERQKASLASEIAFASADLQVSIEVPVKEEVSKLDDWRLFNLDPSIARRLERQIALKANASQNRVMRNNGPNRGLAADAMGYNEASSLQAMQSEGTRFFGSPAYGKKFVFVVDSSTSMRGIRWTTATQELMASLTNLITDAEFFVICFDIVEHPMFDQYPPDNRYLKGNPETLQRVEQWILSLELGHNTYPARALEIAIDMKPDAIFLLSDGKIRDNSVELLRIMNRSRETGKVRIPINTILLMSTEGQPQLQTIAEENGGKFRNVTYEEWLKAHMR